MYVVLKYMKFKQLTKKLISYDNDGFLQSARDL